MEDKLGCGDRPQKGDGGAGRAGCLQQEAARLWAELCVERLQAGEAWRKQSFRGDKEQALMAVVSTPVKEVCEARESRIIRGSLYPSQEFSSPCGLSFG